jgi:23S rRNA U2552 (ribose-2'-O)-methylase RlmE/FtsJ
MRSPIRDLERSMLLCFLFVLQPPLHHTFDVILSDMAPSTSGIKLLDANASHELCVQALQIAKNMLKPSGMIVMVGRRGK